MHQIILNRIYEKRREKKLSQYYMAAQLGMSQSYYNKLEKGKAEVTLKMLIAIADILELNLFNQDLFFNHINGELAAT